MTLVLHEGPGSPRWAVAGGGRTDTAGPSGAAWFVTVGTSAPGESLPVGGRPRFEKRRRRVPADAFVSVSAQLLPPPAERLRLASPRPQPSANDNEAPAGVTPRRWLRELLFLAILAVTLVGAFYSGRIHAFHKVIVVPGPSSARSVVT